MTRVVGYARVSSREQSENSHALEQQTARLLQAGAVEIYSDVESGKKDDRAQFKTMMERVRDGAIKEIAITRLDRLTRSLPTLRKTVDELVKYKVNLRALDDSIDFSTAAGKFHLNMLGALAEMETDRLSERVKHGWQHLRNRGVAMNAPFGYRKIDDKHELDRRPFLCLLESKSERTKAEIAREIVDVFLARQTLRMCLRQINQKYGIQVFAHHQKAGGRVARDLFKFSPAGLRNWLLNPVLQGHLCYLRKKNRQALPQHLWDIRYDTHKEHRLITIAELRQIEEILERNRLVRGYGTTALKYPLSGLVYCADCRSACYSMKGSRGKNQPGYNYYFQCKNWRERACPNKQMVRMEIVEAACIAHLVAKAAAITEYASTRPTQIDPPEIQQLRSQLQGLEQLGHNSAIEAAKNDLRSQIAALQHTIQTDWAVNEELQQILLDSFSDSEYWEGLTDDAKRQIYRALVKRVVVRGGQVSSVELKV